MVESEHQVIWRGDMERGKVGRKGGLRVIKGGFARMENEYREALIEFVVRTGPAHERAKKKLHEIDKRLSRRAELRLITAPESSA
jgi:hypothetical protein